MRTVRDPNAKIPAAPVHGRRSRADLERFSEVRLPELPESRGWGPRAVRRIVSTTILLFAVLGGGAVLVVLLARADLTVRGAGELKPGRIWPVRTLEPGVVSQVLVNSGDTVQQGALLVRIDSLQATGMLKQLRVDLQARELALLRSARSIPVQALRSRAARDEAEAQLARARAALSVQAADFGLSGSLDSLVRNHRPGTNALIDRAMADLRMTEAALRTAALQDQVNQLETIEVSRLRTDMDRLRAEIQMREAQMERLSIRAPAAGIVKTENLERLPGAAVDAGDQLLEISERELWKADLFVSEQHVYEVKVGDPARVEVAAFRTARRDAVSGKVLSVASEPLPQEGGAKGGGRLLYRVTIALDAADVERLGVERLRAGYQVEGWVITGSGRIIEHIIRYLRK
ncbi:MAG TPA: HlyD family efflux transporter periplasmic adaptor subunit [Longimicrobium sp.]|jgi:multidrug resistance efflux pump